jgi:hypothetical protein
VIGVVDDGIESRRLSLQRLLLQHLTSTPPKSESVHKGLHDRVTTPFIVDFIQ